MQKTGSDHYHTRQSPDDVRFTKTTIDLNFPGQHEFENIYDVLRALEQKILQPPSLPSLRIFLHDNQLWTIDNKLLYIYRISPKVRRVSVTFISGIKLIDRFLNDNTKSDLDRMASPDFFPDVVRTLSDAQQQQLPVVHSSSHDCVMLPTVAGFKKLEQERISSLNAHSSPSPKSSSSTSNSSSKTVASRISSDDNVESYMTAGTDTQSPYMRPLRACTAKSKISMGSSNNSSVKSYPVNANARSNCHNNNNNHNRKKKDRNPSHDSSSAGQIYSDDFVETTSVRPFSPDECESNVLDLRATIAIERDGNQQQHPYPSSSSYPMRPVVECRDIPVSSTLPPVNTLTEPVNGTTPGRAIAGAAEHPVVSEPNTPRNFSPYLDCRAESPFSPCSNSAEELSKWRDIDTAFEAAAPDLLRKFSSKPMMMIDQNHAHSENKLTGAGAEAEAEERSRRSSPLKKPPPAPAENSHDSSGSGKDRQFRLDRPLSSCGSSAAPVLERPSTCNFPLDARRSGSIFRLCSSSTVQPDRNGANQSPTKARTRAFLSTDKKSHGKLSREHELEVSKKILLKHMRKAFFSVY